MTCGRFTKKTVRVMAVLAAASLWGPGCSVQQDAHEARVDTPRPRNVTPKGIHRRRTIDEASATSAPAGAHLNYHSGRVVSNMQVVQVIYGTGSYLPQVTSTASPSVATFYQGVLNSAYVDWLTEYDTNTQPAPNSNQIIGRGTCTVGSFWAEMASW